MNESLTYFAGLVASDGNIERKRIRIEISERDEDIIYRLKDEFPSGTITHRNREMDVFGSKYSSNTIKFNLCDVKFIRNFCRDFSIPVGAKSHILHFPKLDEGSERHYMRGYIDGDGSVGFTATNRPFISLITVSSEFAKGYCDFLQRHLGIIKTTSPNTRDKAHNICLPGDKAVPLATLLYKDCSIAMKRKQEAANDIMAWKRPYARTASSPKRWTDEEDAILKTNTNSQAVILLNRPIKSIKIRRWRLNKLLNPA